MEKKIMEKKMLLEVLGDVLNNMRWTITEKEENIKNYQESMKTDPENVREWEKQGAEQSAAYLEMWEQVKKTLEKMM